MKIDFRALWKKILNPPTWAKILTFIVTVISAALSLIIVALGFENTALAIVAYILFGIAGVSLAYSTYLIIPLFPKMWSSPSTSLRSTGFPPSRSGTGCRFRYGR